MASRDERSELVGQVLDGRYRVEASIGVGGTGVVFDATRLSDGQPVVIKTLRPIYALNPDLIRRLRREAEVTRRVQHPGIVPVFDEGTLEDGTPYLVMPFVEGEPMHVLLRRRGTLSVEETLCIAMRVCDILHAAHRMGYVHRDIKPEHIYLQRASNGGLKVKILDFGVCASDTAPLGEKERERGRVFGTPSYVSPEQAAGEPDVDSRADLFGLGVVMFEAIVGRLPFSGSTVTNLLRRIIAEDAPRLGLVCPRVPRDLDAVVARMLARDKNFRFSSARTLQRALGLYVMSRADAELRLAVSLQEFEARKRTEPGEIFAA